MNLSEAINEILTRKSWTKAKLINEAGYTHYSAINTPISRGNIQLSTLYKIMDAANYDIMLVNRDITKGDRPIILEFKSG